MIDPRKPDYSSTPVGPNRPAAWYAPSTGKRRPIVSVVTPFYNGSEVFHETAKCVFGQSLQEWEWCIVNDGSTEPASLEILSEYRTVDGRVRVIDHLKNRGLSAARNTGYREAEAEFIFQLDGDDLIEPTTLEKCLWYLLTHPDSAFVKGFTVGFGAEQYLWSNGFHDGVRMLEENLVTATAMVRRSIHAEVGGYDESIIDGMEDWDFGFDAQETDTGERQCQSTWIGTVGVKHTGCPGETLVIGLQFESSSQGCAESTRSFGRAVSLRVSDITL